MKQLENGLCINFTYEELARLNTMVGIALKSEKIAIDEISDSIHMKIANEIMNYNSNSANASKIEKKFCIECGSKLEAGIKNRYCTNCGRKLHESDKEEL